MKCVALCLLLLCCQTTGSCKNFLIQHCTDIPFELKPITSIKCMQLIPIHFDFSFDYTVQNYLLEKTNSCYSIVSLESPSNTAFSKQCGNLCAQDTCLLFDNYTNTSIINLFYPTSTAYQLNTNNTFSSYDYLSFDNCNTGSGSKSAVVLVVYVLVAVVVTLTIAVVVHFILRRIIKEEFGWKPLNIRWIRDLLCCRLKPRHAPRNKVKPDSSETSSVDFRLPTQMFVVTSSPSPHMISTGSTNTSNNRRNIGQFSSANSSYQPQPNGILEYPSGSGTNEGDSDYFAVLPGSETNSSPTENINRQRSVPLLEKLSSKASATLSARRSSTPYSQLSPKTSLIVTRH